MIDLGTARVKDVLTSLGNPELRIANRVVHVTGTNGKGSTVEMIATGLAGCGYRVGTFTSPFVVHERDSIRVFDSMGKRDISEREWVTAREDPIDHLTDFEILFITAVKFFANQRLDVVVIEVGMGGRDDATNVFDHLPVPPVCVITSISMDHEKFLGNTVELICDNKCGIIKPGSPVVVDGGIGESCLAIVRNRSSPGNMHVVDPNDPKILSLTPPFQGDHQRVLMQVALTVIDLVANGSFSIEQIVKSISGATLHGRLEWRVNDFDFPVLLDGAHNEESAKALRRYVDSQRASGKYRNIFWIIATSQGREGIVPAILSRDDERCCFVKFKSFQEETAGWIQPADPAELARRVVTQNHNIFFSPDGFVSGALKMINEGPSCLVVVAGSLYLVRHYLRLQQNCDS